MKRKDFYSDQEWFAYLNTQREKSAEEVQRIKDKREYYKCSDPDSERSASDTAVMKLEEKVKIDQIRAKASRLKRGILQAVKNIVENEPKIISAQKCWDHLQKCDVSDVLIVEVTHNGKIERYEIYRDGDELFQHLLNKDGQVKDIKSIKFRAIQDHWKAATSS